MKEIRQTDGVRILQNVFVQVLVVERFVDEQRVRLVRSNANADKARDVDVVKITEN